MAASEFRWPLDIRCNPPSTLTQVTRALGVRSVLRPSVATGAAVARYWKLQMNFSGLSARDHRRIASLLTRLDGQVHTLRIGPHDLCKPLGAAAGWGGAVTPPADQAFSDGTRFSDGTGFTDAARQGVLSGDSPEGHDTVLIGGLLPSRADSLFAGDMMEIGGYLYRCLNDASSDAAGQARVMIWPPLRQPARAGAAVLFDNPTSPFQLVEGAAAAVSIGLGHLGSVGLDLVERLPE